MQDRVRLAPHFCLERVHIQPERLIWGQTCSPETPGPGLERVGNDVDVQCMRAGSEPSPDNIDLLTFLP